MAEFFFQYFVKMYKSSIANSKWICPHYVEVKKRCALPFVKKCIYPWSFLMIPFVTASHLKMGWNIFCKNSPIGMHQKHKNGNIILEIRKKSAAVKTKNNLCTQNVLPMFWACNFHEQSFVILWVSWCKNKCFWKIFTCSTDHDSAPRPQRSLFANPKIHVSK